ncbi:hypothetical protein [Actibacterium sp. MT2.3-13A]|uniref:hypothetical protein n=1 Tax=Actibacterium sp. MT2.3-13A TaxID=2828332 RepID=UPI001BA7B7EE|nr:hypothetical protein [Actibacterium sp. MT2.3-13A]
MQPAPRAAPTPRPRPQARTFAAFAGFLGLFLALYAAAFAVAERTVARDGAETAFQRLLAARGEQADWVVLGASHALPLSFGDVPGRLQADTGQSMTVLAEIGAGPLYNRFVFEQALIDLEVQNLLYAVDSFGFGGEAWNEARVGDRKLLRQTPLRLSTAGSLGALVLEGHASPLSLLDYLTGFSKLNPVERFPQEGWRGAADFDRSFRPSRHAVSARIAYLYPEGAPAPATVERYLEILTDLFDRAERAGVKVVVVKLPLTEAFRSQLPREAAFDRMLAERLSARGIPFHDLSAAVEDPSLYFDTDHLNRQGVEALYRDHLRAILAPR